MYNNSLLTYFELMFTERKPETEHEIEKYDHPYFNIQMNSAVSEGGTDSVEDSDPQ